MHVGREETHHCASANARCQKWRKKKREKTIENAALSSIFTSLGSERDTHSGWESNWKLHCACAHPPEPLLPIDRSRQMQANEASEWAMEFRIWKFTYRQLEFSIFFCTARAKFLWKQRQREAAHRPPLTASSHHSIERQQQRKFHQPWGQKQSTQPQRETGERWSHSNVLANNGHAEGPPGSQMRQKIIYLSSAF